MEDEQFFFRLARSRDLDPDGSRLRHAVHVRIACDEARAACAWLLRTVLVLAVPLVAVELWPARFPHRVHSLALGTWVAGCIALAVAVIVEWWCRRLWSQYLAEFPAGMADAAAHVKPPPRSGPLGAAQMSSHDSVGVRTTLPDPVRWTLE